MKYSLVTVWACTMLIMVFGVFALAENRSNNNNNVQRLLSKKKIYKGAPPENSYNTMRDKKNQKQVYQTQKPFEQLTTMPFNTPNTEQYGINSALNYRPQQQQYSMQQQQPQQQQQQYSMQQQQPQQQQQQQYSMQQQQQPIQGMQPQFRKRDLTLNKTGLCPDPKTSEYDFVCGLFQCDSDQSCMGVEKCVNYYFSIYSLAKLTCLFLFYLVFDFVWRPYLHETNRKIKLERKNRNNNKPRFLTDFEKII